MGSRLAPCTWLLQLYETQFDAFRPNMMMLGKERRYATSLLFPEEYKPLARNQHVRQMIRRTANVYRDARINTQRAHFRQKLNRDRHALKSVPNPCG